MQFENQKKELVVKALKALYELESCSYDKTYPVWVYDLYYNLIVVLPISTPLRNARNTCPREFTVITDGDSSDC